MDLSAGLALLLASPAFVPGLLALASAVLVAWLNTRGTFKKQQSDEALALAARQDKYRDELKADLERVRDRFERSEKERLELAAQRFKDLERISDLERELRDVRGLVGTLQRMTGDRRHDPLDTPAIPPVLDVEAVRIQVEHRPPPVDKVEE